MKPIRLTMHALSNLRAYGLATEWLDLTVREPDWTTPDPEPPKERRYRCIPEFGNRILRVVCVEDDDHIRIVTVFADRDARQPDAP